jgi:hypothetical protein
MANKTLFASLRDALIPQTDTVNSENAPAYALAPKQALAQYAATGCFGRTFYAAADEPLTRVLELCDAVDSEFVARVASRGIDRVGAVFSHAPNTPCAPASPPQPRRTRALFHRPDRSHDRAEDLLPRLATNPEHSAAAVQLALRSGFASAVPQHAGGEARVVIAATSDFGS